MSGRDIHININIPQDNDAQDRPQQPKPISAPIRIPATQESRRTSQSYHESVRDIIDRVQLCYSWRNLCELRKKLIEHGLTIEPTTSGRMILCRIEHGKPVYESVIDDYIFLGNKEQLDEEISSRTAEVICSFIERNASGPAKLSNYQPPQYARASTAFYGTPLQIDEAESIAESQEIEHISRLLNE